LPGNAVVKGALSGAQRLSTSHNSISIGKSLPGDVVVKGTLCGTPKTLYFTHLHSNGKKYINCISGKKQSCCFKEGIPYLKNLKTCHGSALHSLYPEKSTRALHVTQFDTFF
jgi:hypothetical protein